MLTVCCCFHTELDAARTVNSRQLQYPLLLDRYLEPHCDPFATERRPLKPKVNARSMSETFGNSHEPWQVPLAPLVGAIGRCHWQVPCAMHLLCHVHLALLVQPSSNWKRDGTGGDHSDSGLRRRHRWGRCQDAEQSNDCDADAE